MPPIFWSRNSTELPILDSVQYTRTRHSRWRFKYAYWSTERTTKACHDLKNYWNMFIQCSICRELGGLTPSGASQPPKFVLTPYGKIVKISQKYIALPPPSSGFPTNRVLHLLPLYSFIQFVLFSCQAASTTDTGVRFPGDTGDTGIYGFPGNIELWINYNIKIFSFQFI